MEIWAEKRKNLEIDEVVALAALLLLLLVLLLLEACGAEGVIGARLVRDEWSRAAVVGRHTHRTDIAEGVETVLPVNSFQRATESVRMVGPGTQRPRHNDCERTYLPFESSDASRAFSVSALVGPRAGFDGDGIC